MNKSEEYKKYEYLMEVMPYEFINNCNIEIEKNYDVICKFEKEFNKKIGVMYESNYIYVVVDLVKSNGSDYFTYERIIQKNYKSAVVVMPMFDNKILLLKQHRHAIRNVQYALPRGFGEIGLTPEENAKKELMEEVGIENDDIKNIKYLGEVIPDSGSMATKVSVFVIEISKYGVSNDIYENIEKSLLVTFEQLEDMISDNTINDGFTLSTITLYKNYINNRPPRKLS